MLLFCFANSNATPIFISSFGNGILNVPTGVAINPNTNQIIVNSSSLNQGMIFDSLGNFQSSFATAASPIGASVNPLNGQILVACNTAGLVQIFDSTGTFISSFGAGVLSNPTDVALNVIGEYYVTDPANFRVVHFNTAGTFVSSFGSAGTGPGQFQSPNGLDINLSTGQIVVSDDAANRRVDIFSNTGTFISQFGTPGTGPGQFEGPFGVAINSITGQIIVADVTGRVQIFDSVGNYQSEIDGLQTPLFIALNTHSGQIMISNGTANIVKIYFDPTMWNLPGTSNLRTLPLNQILSLNNGFNLNVVGTTTLSAGAVLTLNSGSSFVTGTLSMDGGSLSDNNNSIIPSPINLTVNNGTFISGLNNTLTLSGNITGPGSFTKLGPGTIQLSGNNNYTGGTNINNGKLVVNGGILGPVIVNSAGTLAGTGTITGSVLNNGVVSPGNAIGTMTVMGDYSQPGRLNIELDAAGQNSLLQVQGSPGTATLNSNTSSLGLMPDPGFYQPGTLYTILTATGGVTGTFGTVSISNGNFGPLISTQLIYNQNSIQVLLGRKLIPSVEPISVVNFLNNLPFPIPGSDLSNVLVELLTLNSENLGEALHQISSDETIADALVVADNMSLINLLNASRSAALRNCRNGALGAIQSGSRIAPIDYPLNQLQVQNTCEFDCDGGVWLQGFGNVTDQKNEKNGRDRGYDAKSGGFMLGGDHRLPISTTTFMGISIGESYSNIKWDKDGSRANIRNMFASFYSTWYTPQGFYVDGSLSNGFTKYIVNRHIVFANINRHAKSHHNGYEIAPHLGIGFAAGITNEIVLEPFAAADYIYVHENDYKEEGAQILNLDVKKKHSALFRTEAGLSLAKTETFENAFLTIKGRLSYVNKKLATKGHLEAGFLGLPGQFSVKNYNKTRQLISPGIGISLQLFNGGFLSFWYDAELSRKYNLQEAGLKIGIVF